MGTIYIDFKVQGYCEDIKYSIHRYIHICVYIWCCIYIYIYTCIPHMYIIWYMYTYVKCIHICTLIHIYIYRGREREKETKHNDRHNSR